MTRGWLHVGASYAGLRLSDGHVDNKGPEYLYICIMYSTWEDRLPIESPQNHLSSSNAVISDALVSKNFTWNYYRYNIAIRSQVHCPRSAAMQFQLLDTHCHSAHMTASAERRPHAHERNKKVK
jgi:hypothetical protein